MMLQCNCLSSFMVLQFLSDTVDEASLATAFDLVMSVVMEFGEAETRGTRYRAAAIVGLVF